MLGKKPSRTLEEEEFIVSMAGTWAKARELGRTEEAARAVLTALRVRGIAVPEVVRDRILAQKDLSLLERWHEQAILANSIADVLGGPTS
jgi:hypothetical protein